MFKFISENKNVLTFSVFQSVRTLSTQVVIPFFSIILLEASWTTQQITYFFALFTLAGFLFSPIIGKISDNIGRKKIILIGIIFQIIFFLLYFLSNNVYLNLFARFLDGISFACIAIVSLGAFEDLIRERRGFWTGLFLSMGTIGSLIGPILAGFIADNYATKYVLIISIILSAFSIWLLLFIPEKKISKHKEKITWQTVNPLSEIRKFVGNKKLRGMAFIGMLMNAKGEIYTIFFPIFVLTVLELPKHYLGFLLAIPALFHIFQFYYGKLSDKISAEFGTMLGVFIVALSVVFLPLVDSLSGLIILLTFFGIGGGIWNVSAWTLMGNVAKKNDMEGEVVGTYISLTKLGRFLITLVAASIIEVIGISRTLQYFGIVIIIGNCLVYFFFKPVFHKSKDAKHTFHHVIKN